MTREEAIQQLQNCKDLIKQDGQDYLDERDVPILDMAIEALSADRQDDNRLYIKIYADDEPSRKAEKLHQICGETESQEVAQWLKEYFPSADRPTGHIVGHIPTNSVGMFQPTVWATCSECNVPIDPWDKFCRHCGAKMGGDDSE